jgi:short-subunit dehydrogenase
MKLQSMRVLLTGAAGGIGRVIARELATAGAHVLLVDRDARALDQVVKELAFAEDRVAAHVADLTSPVARAQLCDAARGWHGGINVLINNAGLNPFALFEDLAPEQIDLTLAVNLQAPMHLCRDLLPQLRTREAATIVNVGSVFGAIGFPGYVAYSATKFAIRGFTEALRRELADSGVAVKYLAPRATRTTINTAAVEEMNSRLKVSMDPPERVARELVRLLLRRRHSVVVGWPERAFVRINAVLPGIVDRSIRRQLSTIQQFARRLRVPRQPSAAKATVSNQMGSSTV